MSISRKLVSNTIYLFLDWLVLTVAGFLYWVIAGKILLPEELGIVSTSINLAMLLSGVSLLGLGAATWKLVSEYSAKKQEGKVNSLIRFSLKIILISNLAFLIVLLAFSWFLSPILKIPTEAIWLTAIIIFVFSLSTHFGYIIYGFQNMRRYLTTDLSGRLIEVLASATLILLGLRYLGPLIGFLFAFVIIVLLRFFSIPLKGKTEKIDKKKIFFNYALPAFIAGLAWIIFLNGQYVLLTALKNPEATGYFTVAMLVTSPIVVIPSILNSALLPITSQLSANRNSKKKQSYLIELVFRYGLFISLPVIMILILFSKPIILIFATEKFLPASQLFPPLALASIIYGLGSIFHSNLYAMGKTKINRNIVIITTLLFFVLAVPLILLFSAFGLVIAYGAAVTILALLSFFYIRKFLKLELPWKSVGKLIFASLLSFGFLYTTTSFTSGLLIGIPLAIISGIIYLLILIPMRFYIEEDIKILEFLASKLPFFKSQASVLIKFLSRHTEK